MTPHKGSTILYYHDLPVVARWYRDGSNVLSHFFISADIDSDYNGICIDGHLSNAGLYHKFVEMLKEAIE